MYSPSSSSRDDSASEGLPSSVGWASWHWSTGASDLFHLRGESCSLMEARFIVGDLARCFLVWQPAEGLELWPLQPLVAGHVRFVLLDRLIHLMGCQGDLALQFQNPAHAGSPVGLPFKETSYWRDSNSACESWPCQSLSRLLTEVPTLIMKSVASSCAPWRRFSDHVSLLTEREGAAIVLSQHLQQSGEVLGVSRHETPRPVEHIRGVSCQGRHHERHEVRILIIIPVIGDAPRPLPKGAGYILRMSFLASEFRDLNLIREPILLPTPSLLGRGYHLSRYHYSDSYFLFGHVFS